MEGLNDGTALYVAAYPVAWRIEIVNDGSRRGFGCVLLGLDFTRRARTFH